VSDRRQWYTALWPRDLSPDEALQLTMELHGAEANLVWELHATFEQVSHRLGVSLKSAKSLQKRLAVAIPSLVLVPLDNREVARSGMAWRLVRREPFPLATKRAEIVTRSVLATVSSLHDGERITLQWVLGRSLAPALVPQNAVSQNGTGWFSSLALAPLRGNEPMPASERQRLQTKWTLPGWRVSGRIGVESASRSRSRQLAFSLLAALRGAEAPGAHLRLRRTTNRSIVLGRMSLVSTGSVNVEELGLLAAYPLGDFSPTRLLRQSSRLLLPKTQSPGKGVELATTSTGSSIRLPNAKALEHVVLVAPTGGGKSTLCLQMIRQWMQEGRGLCLCDPKGDLASSLLSYIPADRLDDVVWLDPLDTKAVVGLNPFSGNESPDLIADGIRAVFRGLYGDDFGFRSEDIIHAAALTQAHAGNQTLVGLPTLLTNSAVRRKLRQQVSHEPILTQWHAWFDQLSEPERAAMLAAPMNKLRPFMYSKALRRTIGNPRPRFSIDSVFSQRKILLVSLARGQLGDASSLLGALLVNMLWRAIERRVAVAPERRPFVPIVLDEIADYLRLPLDLSEALAKARGYGAGFTLAAQSVYSLPPVLRSGIMTNARSKILFTLGPEDARLMASASAGQLDAADFLNLRRYDIYAELSGQGWLSGTTQPAPAPTSDPEEVKRRSREQYATPIAEIDAALEAQLGLSHGDLDEPIVGRRSLA
jgi:hypothetical protein